MKIIMTGSDDFADLERIVEVLEPYEPSHVAGVYKSTGVSAYIEPYAVFRGIPFTLYTLSPRAVNTGIADWIRHIAMISMIDPAFVVSFGASAISLKFCREVMRRDYKVLYVDGGNITWMQNKGP